MDGGAQSAAEGPRLWRFADVTFDETTRELRVAGIRQHLETQPLALLLCLMAARGAIVTKRELTAAGWGPRGEASDQSIMTAISKIRKALGSADLIAVERGQGYRITRPVTTEPSPIPRPVFGFAPGDPVPGRPRWRLAEPLGTAQANDVWLAVHEASGERRVIKFAEDPERIEAMRHEFGLSRLLAQAYKHDDAFVPVLAADLDARPAWMESAAAGLDLLAWAERQGGLAAIPQPIRLHIAAEVAAALGRAHAVGVLHGDLQPRNILIAADAPGMPRPRLVDFGAGGLTEAARIAVLSRSLQSMAPETGRRQAGALPYAAPELREDARPTVAADLYALGILLYHLAIGEFGRAPAPGWERRVNDPLLCADISAASADDAADRLGSATELAQRLRTLEARRHEAEERERERAALARLREAEAARRRRRPWLAGTGIALAVGVLGIAAAWRSAVHERDVVRAQEQRAQQTAGVLEATIGTLATGFAHGLRDRPGVSVAATAGLLQSAQQALATMARLRPDDTRLRRLQAASLTQFANTYLHEGDVAAAERAATEAASLTRSLLHASPDDPTLLAMLRDAERWLGEIALQRRDIAAAIAADRRSLALAQQVARAQPASTEAQHSLARANNNLGLALAEDGNLDAALASDRAAIALARAGLQAHPDDIEWALDISVAEERAGEVLTQQGRPRDALAIFEDDLVLREHALAHDPENTRFERDLALALNKVADMKVALNDHDGVLALYQRALSLAQSLAAADRSNQDAQRDLLVARTEVADERAALGDLPAAIAMYEENLAMAARLAAQSPQSGQLADDRIICENNLAEYEGRAKRTEEGRAHARHALDLLARALAERPHDTELQALRVELGKTAAGLGLACGAEPCATKSGS
jgi:eukaryotic-like serine/threonine-protein kinase